jgi:NAD(P)-dependent dehydrogenase (short-subunit alcohol dehydrogenase family)
MNSLFELNGRDIWVIGGAGYLGTASIRLLVEAGANVLCVDIGNRAQDMVVREKLADKVTPETFDASDGETTQKFIKACLERRGTPAGLVVMTYKSFPKSMNELLPSEFDEANRVSLTATFIIAREVGNAMAEKGRGSVVIFSSMYGTVAPDPKMYPAPLTPNPIEYGVAKSGLQQMARYLAVHWAPSNVRCNSISPGPFPFPSQQGKNPAWMQRIRDRCPMGRIGQPEEMAGAVLFLLADASSYVTGHNLAVDGGWTAW